MLATYNSYDSVFLQGENSALHSASAIGNIPAVELLLRYGAAINQIDNVS